jgi:hypothetical protein
MTVSDAGALDLLQKFKGVLRDESANLSPLGFHEDGDGKNDDGTTTTNKMQHRSLLKRKKKKRKQSIEILLEKLEATEVTALSNDASSLSTASSNKKGKPKKRKRRRRKQRSGSAGNEDISAWEIVKSNDEGEGNSEGIEWEWESDSDMGPNCDESSSDGGDGDGNDDEADENLMEDLLGMVEKAATQGGAEGEINPELFRKMTGKDVVVCAQKWMDKTIKDVDGKSGIGNYVSQDFREWAKLEEVTAFGLLDGDDDFMKLCGLGDDSDDFDFELEGDETGDSAASCVSPSIATPVEQKAPQDDVWVSLIKRRRKSSIGVNKLNVDDKVHHVKNVLMQTIAKRRESMGPGFDDGLALPPSRSRAGTEEDTHCTGTTEQSHTTTAMPTEVAQTKSKKSVTWGVDKILLFSDAQPALSLSPTNAGFRGDVDARSETTGRSTSQAGLTTAVASPLRRASFREDMQIVKETWASTTIQSVVRMCMSKAEVDLLRNWKQRNALRTITPRPFVPIALPVPNSEVSQARNNASRSIRPLESLATVEAHSGEIPESSQPDGSWTVDRSLLNELQASLDVTSRNRAKQELHSLLGSNGGQRGRGLEGESFQRGGNVARHGGGARRLKNRSATSTKAAHKKDNDHLNSTSTVPVPHPPRPSTASQGRFRGRATSSFPRPHTSDGNVPSRSRLVSDCDNAAVPSVPDPTSSFESSFYHPSGAFAR